MPAGVVPANLAAYPQREPHTARPGLLRGALQHAPLAEDVAWMVAHTRLPVIVKGVLHPDDAVLMRSLGAAGVIVSNHGGRTFDGVPASLAMLPAVRAAVEPDPRAAGGARRPRADRHVSPRLSAGRAEAAQHRLGQQSPQALRAVRVS